MTVPAIHLHAQAEREALHCFASGYDERMRLNSGFDTLIIPVGAVGLDAIPGVGSVDLNPGSLIFVPFTCRREIRFRGNFDVIVVDASPTLRREIEACVHDEPLHALPCTRIVRNPQQINAIVQVTRRLMAAGDNCMTSSATSIARLLLWEVILNLEEAEPAGRPRITQLDPAKVRTVQNIVEANIEEPLTLAELASQVGISRYHFVRAFKEATGFSPVQYVLARRVERARQMLLEGSDSIAEIAYGTGFSSQSHLNRVFKKHFGVTPGAMKKAQRLRQR